MSALSSTALLGLTLLAVPVDATAQAPLPACEAGTRYIELDANAPSRTPEVCIRPELSISLLFDAKLARVEVEGQERFRRVKVADDGGKRRASRPSAAGRWGSRGSSPTAG